MREIHVPDVWHGRSGQTYRAGRQVRQGGVRPQERAPRQKGATELAIKDITVGGRRYVLCRNEEEAKKDAEARVAIIASLERKLVQGDKTLVGNKGYRRFLATPGDEHFTIDPVSPKTNALTVCLYCALTPRCQPYRSRCAIAT
jgi:hypothetical protein